MAETILELEGVSLKKNGQLILADLDWKVEGGQHWAILGPNGAGKSFLLRLLSAQYFPTTGTISILGKRLGTYDVWKLKTHIGFVSDLLQKNYHENHCGEEVVLSGFFSSIGLYDTVTPAMESRGAELINLLGLKELAPKPFGRMSHGQQRRFLLARAMVLEPELLVLDEPCSGLDPQAREIFLNSLARLATHTTLIFVTHNPEEIIPAIKNVLFLKQGRIFAQGTKAELLTSGRLSQLFDHNLEVFTQDERYYLRFRN